MNIKIRTRWNEWIPASQYLIGTVWEDKTRQDKRKPSPLLDCHKVLYKHARYLKGKERKGTDFSFIIHANFRDRETRKEEEEGKTQSDALKVVRKTSVHQSSPVQTVVLAFQSILPI